MRQVIARYGKTLAQFLAHVARVLGCWGAGVLGVLGPGSVVGAWNGIPATGGQRRRGNQMQKGAEGRRQHGMGQSTHTLPDRHGPRHGSVSCCLLACCLLLAACCMLVGWYLILYYDRMQTVRSCQQAKQRPARILRIIRALQKETKATATQRRRHGVPCHAMLRCFFVWPPARGRAVIQSPPAGSRPRLSLRSVFPFFLLFFLSSLSFFFSSLLLFPSSLGQEPDAMSPLLPGPSHLPFLLPFGLAPNTSAAMSVLAAVLWLWPAVDSCVSRAPTRNSVLLPATGISLIPPPPPLSAAMPRSTTWKGRRRGKLLRCAVEGARSGAVSDDP